jgi:hypothetical protein
MSITGVDGPTDGRMADILHDDIARYLRLTDG